ncbi:alpha-amylase [Mycena polygramma]|nr:alpha-amylase [Mycena polygramma]
MIFTSLSAVALLSLVSLDSASASQSTLFRRAPPKAHNTIVQLFEWPWDSVASECTSFLGPAGFGYVQVSPPTEHITGTQWWTDYQTVSYILTTKRGNRTQFANMVSTCAKAGVGVIADVVLNHMTAGSGKGFAGSSYTKYSYPAVPYTSSNFHYCAGTTAAGISNYNDPNNVRTCELVGLADLDQSQTAVRTKMAAFLNDLLSLGVAGFRIDAAKHMNPTDLAAIWTLLTAPFYDTQEVVYGGAVLPSQYTATGDVIEFRATSSVQTAFTGSPGIASLVTPSPLGTGFVDSSVANVIVANQDTERGGSSLNYQSPNNGYLLSAIFLLGFNYGTPTVFSGYNFSSTDAGAPQNAAGLTNAVTCSTNGWRCEHRWPAIANMNAFRNAVGGAAVTNVLTGTSQQVAFGRGAIGFLVINNDVSTWSTTWTTSLPAGTYCDIIHDTTQDPTTCNGPSYTVSSTGQLTASVAPRDALAIFTGAVGAPAAPVVPVPVTPAPAAPTTAAAPASTAATVTFKETATTVTNEVIKIVGSIGALGNWAPASAIALTNVNSVWSVTLALPANTAFQYKFIRVKSGAVSWESDPNRSYTTLGQGSSTTLTSGFK